MRRIDGIVFVGMRPFYGLNLYLDLEIEAVQIGGRRYEYSKFVAEEDLCAGLASRENNVYAMKESRATGFDAAMQRRDGLRAERIGQFEADGNCTALFPVKWRLLPGNGHILGEWFPLRSPPAGHSLSVERCGP